jgi:metallothionein
MPDTKEQKCAHENCTCTAAEGSKYCSANCEAAKGTTDLACGCGHPGCKGAVAAA